jgi:hypothetical protein
MKTFSAQFGFTGSHPIGFRRPSRQRKTGRGSDVASTTGRGLPRLLPKHGFLRIQRTEPISQPNGPTSLCSPPNARVWPWLHIRPQTSGTFRTDSFDHRAPISKLNLKRAAMVPGQNDFFTVSVRWPKAGATATCRGGGFLGNTCRAWASWLGGLRPGAIERGGMIYCSAISRLGMLGGACAHPRGSRLGSLRWLEINT